MALSTQPDPGEQKEISRAEPPTKAHTAPAPISAPVLKESAPKDRRESIFGPGVTIEGTIEGDADLRIAGKFKGEIQIKGELCIDKGAHIAAKINAPIVTIAGELEGNIVAGSQVKLLESGQFIGDLKAPTLTVAAGSRMRGHVEFGWSPTETAKLTGGRTSGSNNGSAG
jgi:cytoskeletal protein CcmA (bactofilin family)